MEKVTLNNNKQPKLIIVIKQNGCNDIIAYFGVDKLPMPFVLILMNSYKHFSE